MDEKLGVLGVGILGGLFFGFVVLRSQAEKTRDLRREAYEEAAAQKRELQFRPSLN